MTEGEKEERERKTGGRERVREESTLQKPSHGTTKSTPPRRYNFTKEKHCLSAQTNKEDMPRS